MDRARRCSRLLAGKFQLDFFRGTLAPFLRASESPMAMACLRLFTVPPLPPFPLFKVPFFSRCIALFTLLPAAFPYRAISIFLRFKFHRGTSSAGTSHNYPLRRQSHCIPRYTDKLRSVAVSPLVYL